MTAVANPVRSERRDQMKVTYTPADFARISSLLHQLTGIQLTESSDRMVYARLAARVIELNLDTFAAYLDRVLNPAETEERDRFVSALTTNTTHFYRESHHFDFLETEVLPGLIERARSGQRVRIWSAGCSTGEEPYSIALCLLKAFPDAGSHDVKILATDVDREVLARAEAGTYGVNSLREVPQPLIDAGLDCVKSPELWSPKPKVRSLVTFRRLNLIDTWPFQGKFDVIFCRNVAIYMHEDTQEKIWSAFGNVLHPDGYLFIGHTERMSPSLRSKFTIVGKTIYRREP
jgi:chemotaxis protein methyltransferase CheR